MRCEVGLECSQVTEESQAAITVTLVVVVVVVVAVVVSKTNNFQLTVSNLVCLSCNL